MVEIEELATRMKLMGGAAADRSDSASDFSAESGGGTSSRFSSSAASEDGNAKEASLSFRSGISETDMMKERFAKLLLGEDMSGGGKGVSTALAISNAITNLFASIFGNLWRLEPLPVEKKEMWRREMDWLLSVTDHIVEMVPSYKTFPDGTKLEIMTCKPRSDLFINLPALRKLDSMLIELLDGFGDTEFWYVDPGKTDVDADGSVLFDKALERQKEKWWLPVPRTPADGLSTDSTTQLQRRRECAKQILKAAMTINTGAISDMEVPGSYLESLPKTGRACLGDSFYRFIASDHFSIESLFECLDLSADHVVLELANRLEAAINFWRKRSHSHSNLLVSSNWPATVEAQRRELLAGRAEDLLLTLKQNFPNLWQTTLEATKIQCNKDVGLSILESYSRVLESLAYNIIARIDDLLTIDKLTDHTEDHSSLSPLLTPRHHSAPSLHSVSLSNTPARTPPGTPHFSAMPLLSPAKSEIVPFLNKLPRHSNRAKRVLACYLCRGPRSTKEDSPGKTGTARPPSHPNRARSSEQKS